MELFEDLDARRNTPGKVVVREVEARHGPQGREVEGLQCPSQLHPPQRDTADHWLVPALVHAGTTTDAAPVARRQLVSPGAQGMLAGFGC